MKCPCCEREVERIFRCGICGRFDGCDICMTFHEEVRHPEPGEEERRTWARIADKLPNISLEEQHRLEEIDAESQSDLAGYPDPATHPRFA